MPSRQQVPKVPQDSKFSAEPPDVFDVVRQTLEVTSPRCQSHTIAWADGRQVLNVVRFPFLALAWGGGGGGGGRGGGGYGAIFSSDNHRNSSRAAVSRDCSFRGWLLSLLEKKSESTWRRRIANRNAIGFAIVILCLIWVWVSGIVLGWTG